MGGTSAWLSGAVAVADAATQALGLQEDLQHEAFVSQDVSGRRSFDAPVSRSALVQRKQGKLTRPDGQEVAYRVVVSFLSQVAVDVRDRITLQDGTTGPILDPQGAMLDPTTGAPFVRTVYLG
jgi:hypothetical protein